ncbi:MAG: ribosome maturation factor RimP [Solirubrobacterales bacterium]|nr:ribosome maturation factor RimP [Solirubrobacterales bacterium]
MRYPGTTSRCRAPRGPAAGPTWATPTFFFVGGVFHVSIQSDIEARLAERAPEVEVLLAELLGGTTVRLFIDHPEGVTIALCERVTHQLPEVRERYALEVSSPGTQRPLSKPDHFRRFLGHRARVRTRGAHEGHRSFTGELVGASDAEVTIAADTGVVAIPYAEIHRSNLMEDH